MKVLTPEEVREVLKADQHYQIRELLPAINWHQLWEDEEEEEWLLYPLIPARRLIALFSAAKTGKSLLMLEIAAALSAGRKVLGHDPGRRIRVLYVDFENDPRGDVRTRLQDMGYTPGDLEHLDYLSFPSLPYLDSPAGASALIAAVEAYGPELVVIDTISRAVGGEENDNDTWLNLYKHTGLALKKAQVAMIRLDHTGKDEAKGQRGGSAKAGDVDAIWKLSTVVRDERYALTCLNARFAIQDKELTLLRHDYPLHHSLYDSKPLDDREAKILHAVKLADEDGIATGLGRDKLKEWGVSRGLQLRNDVWSEVVKRRKAGFPTVVKFGDTPGWMAKLTDQEIAALNDASGATRPTAKNEDTPKKAVPDLSPGNFSKPVPKTVPELSPRSSTNGHNPLSELSPGSGDSYGTAPSTGPVPVASTPVRGATGQGQEPGQKCPECGWDRFHKAICSRNPMRREVEVDE